MKRRTASGKMLDMSDLAAKNASTVAAGNMAVNAAGDEIDSNRNVVRRGNEIAVEDSKRSKKSVHRGSLKPKFTGSEDNVELEQPTAKPRKGKVKANETELSDGSIVIESDTKDSN